MMFGEVLHRVSRRFFEVDGVERAAPRRFTFLFFCHGFKDYEDFSNWKVKVKSS